MTNKIEQFANSVDFETPGRMVGAAYPALSTITTLSTTVTTVTTIFGANDQEDISVEAPTAEDASVGQLVAARVGALG